MKNQDIKILLYKASGKSDFEIWLAEELNQAEDAYYKTKDNTTTAGSILTANNLGRYKALLKVRDTYYDLKNKE